MVRYQSRKGQAFTVDFFFSLVIFSIVLIIMFKFYPRVQAQDTSSLDSVYYDAEVLATTIGSQGFPSDYNETNYMRIGIISNGVEIDPLKMQIFKNISINNYQGSRASFSITSDYVVIFLNATSDILNISNVTYIGSPEIGYDVSTNSINVSNVDAQTIVKLERHFIYNDTSLRMVVYAWN